MNLKSIKHRVKILPNNFDDLYLEKSFELRKDDRGYEVDDRILFEEWDGEKYTGNGIVTHIKFILRDVPQYGLKEGHCILGVGEKLLINTIAMSLTVPREVTYLEDNKKCCPQSADEIICPNCKKDLMGAYGIIEENPLHCCYCGQILIWGE